MRTYNCVYEKSTGAPFHEKYFGAADGFADGCDFAFLRARWMGNLRRWWRRRRRRNGRGWRAGSGAAGSAGVHGAVESSVAERPCAENGIGAVLVPFIERGIAEIKFAN